MAKSELAVINPKEWQLAKADLKQTEDLLRQNLGDGGLGEMDLYRVGIPAGGGLAWGIVNPKTGEEESCTEIVGVLVGQGNRRAYWDKPFGEGDVVPPACTSPDGVRGFGSPGGMCSACEKAQYGTKVKPGGGMGRGQACQARKFLFIIRENDRLPFILSCSPASLENARKYLLRLSSMGYALNRVVTRMKLEQDKNADSIKFSKVTFEMVQALDEPTAAVFSKISEMFRPIMGSAQIRSADVVAEQ